jgi:hypothetical protein
LGEVILAFGKYYYGFDVIGSGLIKFIAVMVDLLLCFLNWKGEGLLYLLIWRVISVVSLLSTSARTPSQLFIA